MYTLHTVFGFWFQRFSIIIPCSLPEEVDSLKLILNTETGSLRISFRHCHTTYRTDSQSDLAPLMRDWDGKKSYAMWDQAGSGQ